MERKRTIEVLNSLITINNDRIEGYGTASKATEEHELQALFQRFISTSQQCNQALIKEVRQLGGEEAEGTKVSGKFFRVWMDVKAALTGKDRKAILKSCEFGEDNAKDTYDDALKNDSEHLSAGQQSMIREQRLLLVADYDHLKALRGALENA